MTFANSQWQEAIVALENSGPGGTALAATGASVPADAIYTGINDQSGKLTGAVSANTAHTTTGNGLLGVGLLGGGGGGAWYNIAVSNGGSDAQTAGATGLVTVPFNQLYNGVSWDRHSGNLDNVALLASAAHTTTQTIDNIPNFNARGVTICVDTTVLPGSAVSNVVTILGKDPVSGKYNLLLTGAAIVGVSTVFYTIYPGATVAANLTVSFPLPRTYKVVITSGNANSCTYSVGASYIL